ncbi:MAG: aspartyl protease [Deltaproteobacteria bacterium RIFCSPLOWO2_02_56_12]|nr:MAG: aspartyl protease [Deltaproteobacteria bacterium GWD2_55_8]OGP97505.1 MAG: aspartyl protease [Deltaproteobacteria bacterium RBG_16_55_12]OGQ52235.1 MAG: aspartyl protease [Deltaproteobacteria bacterium RIFCSPLOWO2_02_56_12]OGQ96126.1 MAG: aspartyl protease [Deltaproteobacteria bacterium RIFOXYA2_FULL_55_11]HBA38279.1 aspartyl protease [Deltaproteobacteria bacterium]
MGLTFIQATVAGTRGRKRTLRFLVDSGASYTVLPEKVWKGIGLRPKRELTFTLADGTELPRKVSECLLRYNGLEAHTPVILGERGDQALLGAVTLEILGLVLNPFTRTLQPMKLMVAKH